MTENQYRGIVTECNNAIFGNKTSFQFEGQTYSTNFKYVLAVMGDTYGFHANLTDKYIHLKSKK